VFENECMSFSMACVVDVTLIVDRVIIREDEVSLRRLIHPLLFVDRLSREFIYQVELSVVFLSIFYVCVILLLP